MVYQLAADTNRAAAQTLLAWVKEDEAMTDAESAENEKILRAIDAGRHSERKLFAHLRRGNKP